MSADTREKNKAVEAMAHGIWSDQRSRLTNQDGIAARAVWRSPSIPAVFWDGYENDARASLLALAANVTDEMVERGAKKLAGNGSPAWVYQELACDCFAEMCRAAAEQ